MKHSNIYAKTAVASGIAVVVLLLANVAVLLPIYSLVNATDKTVADAKLHSASSTISLIHFLTIAAAIVLVISLILTFSRGIKKK